MTQSLRLSDIAPLVPAAQREVAAPPLPVLRIAGVDVADLTLAQALAHLDEHLRERRFLRVAFLNAHCANTAVERPAYRAVLERFVVLSDGVGVDIAARLIHGAAFKDNLNGTDFLPAFLAHRREPLRVALLGGVPGMAERAARSCAERFPRHTFLPVSHGFLAGPVDRARALKRLSEARADIVLVAMGVPAQELFIAESIGPEQATIVFGVGALLDFWAGAVRRAPPTVRRLRLEWAWRLSQEPKRLFRRYVVGNPLFIARAAREALAKRLLSR